MGMVTFEQFDIVIITLDPAVGSEMKKTRPCLIISPDEMNRNLRTLIVGPLTSTIKDYPTRILINFQDRVSSLALDQICAIDRSRIIRKIGFIDSKEIRKEVSDLLREIFAI